MLTRLLPWLYAKVNAGRWLRTRPAERLYAAALFLYKRHVEDPFAGLTRVHPEFFRGGHVLDVGANIGYTATVFAAAIGPGFRVFAFEPEPVNFRRMLDVIARRGLEAVVMPAGVAVGDAEGDVDLVINEFHPGDHHVAAGDGGAETIRVPMITLDAFTARERIEPVRFVKIDVQGFELAVSRGMAAVLDRNRDIVVAFEYHEQSARAFGYDLPALTSFYRDRGFEIFVLERAGRLRDSTPATIDRLCTHRGYVDLLAVRGNHQ